MVQISYRKDDFRIPEEWSTTFRGNVGSTYLEGLEPFTEYIIKLECKNKNGIGKAKTLRAKTAEGGTSTKELTVSIKAISLLGHIVYETVLRKNDCFESWLSIAAL